MRISASLRIDETEFQGKTVAGTTARSPAGRQGKPAKALTRSAPKRGGIPSAKRRTAIRANDESPIRIAIPDDYILKGSMGAMARQIGSEVPVHGAQLVGSRLIEHPKDAERLP